MHFANSKNRFNALWVFILAFLHTGTGLFAGATNPTMSCHSVTNLSLNQTCRALVSYTDILSSIPDNETFSLELMDKYGDPIYGNMLTIDHLWTRVTAKVIANSTGNSCWGFIEVEDKLAPMISCDSYVVDCFDEYNFLPYHTDACGTSSLQLLDQYYEEQSCDDNLKRIIYSQYIAIDEFGNKSLPCTQEVGISRFECDLVEFPQDYESLNMTNLLCSEVEFIDGFPSIEDTGVPTYKGYEFTPYNEECDIVVQYEDLLISDSGCAQKFMRTWSIYRDSCNVFIVKRHQQTIEIEDTQDPVITCPDSRSVNTDGSPGCDAEVVLELAEYTDDCNQVIEMDIVTPEIFYNNIDTMPELVLDVGVNVIEYTIYDACDNSATCESVITVVDNAAPVARCDESTVVSLRSDGTASANSYSFDEGSFDDCNLYKNLIKRIDSPCECPVPQYHDMRYLGEWNENHYYISTIERYGFEAFNYSVAQGGTILKTETVSEHDWVLDKVREYTDEPYLIGLKDKDSIGVFHWFDYTYPTIDLWDDSEPGDDIYVTVNESGYWETVDATLDRFFFVMELDEPCNFSDRVYFCCEDAGQEVPLVLRVLDRFGRYNDCEFTTEVQDKLAPVISCPDDLLLDCSIEVDTSNLDLYGMATATDQCYADINTDFLYDVNDCGIGQIIRNFTASDANGESTCDQVISLEMLGGPVEFDIVWPDDYESDLGCLEGDLDPENLPDGFGYPDFAQTDCSILNATYDDQVYSFVGVGAEACFKVIRTWTVTDECLLDNVEYEPIQYEQVLKISNVSAPELDEGCQDITVSTDDCNEAQVVFEVIASDDCTLPENLRGSLFLDIDGDGQGEFDIEQDYFEDIVEFDMVLEVGFHFALIEFSDQCGNSSTCTKMITVESTTGPNAECVPGLITVIQDMDLDGDGEIDGQMAVLIPENLDSYNPSLDNEGSNHPCDYEFSFSFSDDPDDQMRIFDCDDVDGMHTLDLWVTDEFGNTDVCSTIVDVQDTQNRCDANFDDTHDISGRIMTQDDILLNGVLVQVQGSSMDPQSSLTDGEFAFPELPGGQYYILKVTKNDNPLNGVSTLDLLKIQRHILGLEELDSPYKMIAADIDRSNSISARDLIELRKLILGVYNEFPENESWRMMDSEYKFSDPEDPFMNEIPDDYEIIDLQNSMNIDFLGIKVGDVDNSNSLSSGENIQRRYNNRSYLRVEDSTLEEASIHELVFSLENEMDVEGIQLSMDFNSELCEVLGFEALDLGISSQNLNLSDIKDGSLLISWNEANSENEAQDLFKVLIKTKTRCSVSDLVHFAHDQLNAEMYTGSNIFELELKFESPENINNGFLLYQNSPNPWQDMTIIKYYIDNEEDVKFSVFDINGRLVYQEQKISNEGVNIIQLAKEDINAEGVLYYELQAGTNREIRKMILIE